MQPGESLCEVPECLQTDKLCRRKKSPCDSNAVGEAIDRLSELICLDDGLETGEHCCGSGDPRLRADEHETADLWPQLDSESARDRANAASEHGLQDSGVSMVLFNRRFNAFWPPSEESSELAVFIDCYPFAEVL